MGDEAERRCSKDQRGPRRTRHEHGERSPCLRAKEPPEGRPRLVCTVARGHRSLTGTKAGRSLHRRPPPSRAGHGQGHTRRVGRRRYRCAPPSVKESTDAPSAAAGWPSGVNVVRVRP
jgi:hypothetical protein